MTGQPGRRLAAVVPSLDKGVRYWAATVDALEAEGIRVRVFTSLPPSDPSSLPLQVVPGGFLVRRTVGVYWKTVMFTSPRLLLELVRWRPDVLIGVEYSVATLWTILAGRLLRRRVLIYQEHRSRHDLGLPRWRRIYRRLLVRLAHGVIANTTAAEEEILQILRVGAGRVHRLTLMLPPPREALCRRPLALDEPPVRPLFLFVGMLIPGKNAEVMVEAADRLRSQGVRCSIWIAGDGPERPRLEESVARLGLQQTIRLLGPVPYESMGFLYRKCDVLVMPTWSDYRSVAVLEAMRFGRAVIDSRLDGNAGDAVHDGVNGFVFEPDDAVGLADLMARFARDPDLSREMGRASKRLLGEQTLAAAARELAELVRSS
jgi:glycosyltransferase involved in cell wall biosynthesis